VFAEFHRTLRPGGYLLIAFHSDDPQRGAREFDHKVSLAYRWSPHGIAELLGQAGLVEVARLLREPDQAERFRQARLLARKPETS
jgi:predicted methyltransferase